MPYYTILYYTTVTVHGKRMISQRLESLFFASHLKNMVVKHLKVVWFGDGGLHHPTIVVMVTLLRGCAINISMNRSLSPL